MYLNIEKVVSEHIFRIEDKGVDITVKGRITEKDDPDNDKRFSWTVSHYYSGTDTHIHRPGATAALTFEMAKDVMFGYIQNFNTLNIEQNKYY